MLYEHLAFDRDNRVEMHGKFESYFERSNERDVGE
jgi:hypothetical protein